MRMVIKFVLYALVVILLVSWLTTVIRSCGDDSDTAAAIEQPAEEMTGEGSPEEEALVNELLESAESGEQSEAADAQDVQITSIDYSKKLDADEEAMLKEMAREKEKAEVKPAPAKTPAPAPAKQTTKPAASSGPLGYFVITGSFGEKANAEKQRSKLASLGYSGAEVVQFDGATLFTVIAGRYSSNGEASRTADQLKSKHKIDCYVKKQER